MGYGGGTFVKVPPHPLKTFEFLGEFLRRRFWIPTFVGMTISFVGRTIAIGDSPAPIKPPGPIKGPGGFRRLSNRLMGRG